MAEKLGITEGLHLLWNAGFRVAFDLVPHLLRDDYTAEEVLEQCELSDAAEVDERVRVGDDDHRDSSVVTSFFRISTE